MAQALPLLNIISPASRHWLEPLPRVGWIASLELEAPSWQQQLGVGCGNTQIQLPQCTKTRRCAYCTPLFKIRVVADVCRRGPFSRGTTRDKPTWTNRAEFAVFRRFLQIFRLSWELQHFGGADFRRKPQPQNFAETRLSHLACPF